MVRPISLNGVKVLPVGIEEAQDEVIPYVSRKNGDYFCLADLHLMMECYANHEVRRVVNASAANFPDGMAVAWGLKILGSRFKYRVRGTDLMLRLCAYASKHDLRIFLYGNTDENLGRLKERLKVLFPNIHFVGAISPPFRELSMKEDQTIVAQINKVKPDILFVSLGAPKQEKWMAAHKDKVKALQLGVGAAFDLITGAVKQAPKWMQKTGLEWLYRMPQQPMKTTLRMVMLPKFAFLVLRELIRNGKRGS